MSASLRRVLRLRELVEELRRMELETEARRLRELERRSDEAVVEAGNSRRGSFASMEAVSGDDWQAGDDIRLAEEASWGLALRVREEVDARRPGQTARVELARREFFAGRGERMQVEALLDAAAGVERVERGRREQRQLDDWFQSRGRGGARSRDGD